MNNLDSKTVSSFGDEWSRFDQTGMSVKETRKVFDEYFSVFPWEILPSNAEGFDMGCGSGRWASLVAPQVGFLHCIDPSTAIDVARENLANHKNIQFHAASVDAPGLLPESQDFGYSLGVLHHVPDTAEAICSCVNLLKPGAPMLLYLYYAFDNRPFWFRMIWRVSEAGRWIISRMPSWLKHSLTDMIAALVYYPLALLSRSMERLGINVSSVPLSYYRKHSFYTMRTDARDRFGTPLEQRFSRTQILEMMKDAGLEEIRFSEHQPFWCAVGIKKHG